MIQVFPGPCLMTSHDLRFQILRHSDGPSPPVMKVVVHGDENARDDEVAYGGG